MTELHLHIEQPYVHGSLEAGAIASVRLVADARGKPVEEWWGEEKTVGVTGGQGSSTAPTKFVLPRGGYYDVEITLPRGADVRQQVLVKEGEEQPQTITLPVSPHEYLGWQQFAGIVRKDPYSREDQQHSVPKFAGDARRDQLMAKGQERVEALYRDTGEVPRVFAANLPPGSAAWVRVAGGSSPRGRSWPRNSAIASWNPVFDDEYVTWFPAMPDRDEGMQLVAAFKDGTIPGSLEEKFPRWLSIVSDGQTDLASVPWAWWGGVEREEGEEIRFVYDRVRPGSVGGVTPGHLTMSVQDRRWFSLLEFLSSGRLNRAKEIFKSEITAPDTAVLFEAPEVALFGKSKGPLVAVAGAIILVVGAPTAEAEPWDPWLENLYNWFPAIPDGAILLGSRRVQQARDETALTSAFNLLKEGVGRGIPFFSSTVQLLTSALSQVAGDIPEADEVRHQISVVSASVDPNQPFTVIRLGSQG